MYVHGYSTKPTTPFTNLLRCVVVPCKLLIWLLRGRLCPRHLLHGAWQWRLRSGVSNVPTSGFWRWRHLLYCSCRGERDVAQSLYTGWLISPFCTLLLHLGLLSFFFTFFSFFFLRLFLFLFCFKDGELTDPDGIVDCRIGWSAGLSLCSFPTWIDCLYPYP